VKTERQLGNLWAAKHHRLGNWTLKIPSSSTAGIPDWLLLIGGIQLWEAKRILVGGRFAYTPKQLSAAQRFFQRMLKCYAPHAGGVLVLGEHGYVELSPGQALAKGGLTHRGFLRRQELY
jgi:hypothetical protein